MSWFKREKCKPVSVCVACGVHFDPRFDDRWPEYCFECRKPHKERQERLDLVCEWARANLDKLEPQAKKWRAKKDKANQKYYAKQQEMLRPQNPYGQMMSGQSYGYSPFGRLI